MPQYGMVLTGPQMGAGTESITNTPLTLPNFPTSSSTAALPTQSSRRQNVTMHQIPIPSLPVSHPNNEPKWRVSEPSICNIPIAMIKTGTKFLHQSVWSIGRKQSSLEVLTRSRSVGYVATMGNATTGADQAPLSEETNFYICIWALSSSSVEFSYLIICFCE